MPSAWQSASVLLCMARAYAAIEASASVAIGLGALGAYMQNRARARMLIGVRHVSKCSLDSLLLACSFGVLEFHIGARWLACSSHFSLARVLACRVKLALERIL